MFWFFKRTPQDHSGAEKFAYHDTRQYLLYQNYASAFAAPIAKNLAPIGYMRAEQGPNIMALPAQVISGIAGGGVISGQFLFAPLQNPSMSSGGF